MTATETTYTKALQSLRDVEISYYKRATELLVAGSDADLAQVRSCEDKADAAAEAILVMKAARIMKKAKAI